MAALSSYCVISSTHTNIISLSHSKMALNGYTTPTGTPPTQIPSRRSFKIPSFASPAVPSWPQSRAHHQLLVVVSATKKASSSSPRVGKFDSKNKRSSVSTKEEEEELERRDEIGGDGETRDVVYDDGFVMPKLPGEEPDFWEGPQWDGFGFFVQYMWAFGILFAIISGVVAVASFNEGATDFKETPAYKESIQSQELLEEPEESSSDVFESNPTEEAPSLE